MSDEQYLIPSPPEPEKTQPAQHPRDRSRASWSLVIACVALCISVWAVYESRQSRSEEFRPFLEITSNPGFITESSLELMVRNSGRRTAFHFQNRSACEFGSDLILPPPLRQESQHKVKIEMGTLFQPDVPSGATFATIGYLPSPFLLRARGFPYDEKATYVVRMTGEMTYTSEPEGGNSYALPWCYMVTVAPNTKPGMLVCSDLMGTGRLARRGGSNESK